MKEEKKFYYVKGYNDSQNDERADQRGLIQIFGFHIPFVYNYLVDFSTSI